MNDCQRMRTVADPDERRAIDLSELRDAAVTSLKACAATIVQDSLFSKTVGPKTKSHSLERDQAALVVLPDTFPT